MKTAILNFFAMSFIALAIFTQACKSDHKKNKGGSAAAENTTASDFTAGDATTDFRNDTQGNQFLEQAAISGMVEVQMAKIGQQKATLKSIKDFSAMIEKDHTQANAQLSALATAKSLQLPTAIPAMKKKHLTDLSNTTGKDFDNYFINMMVEDHINDISLFEGAAKSPDTAIRSFAIRILPILQKHYQQAREISRQFDDPSGHGHHKSIN